MLVRKIASYKYIKKDTKEGNKRDKGYKRVNYLKISLREGFCRVYL